MPLVTIRVEFAEPDDSVNDATRLIVFLQRKPMGPELTKVVNIPNATYASLTVATLKSNIVAKAIELYADKGFGVLNPSEIWIFGLPEVG